MTGDLFLTPDSSASTIDEASLLPGNASQQAFGAEYNIFGIKENLTIAMTASSYGNNAGMPGVVGNSDPQTALAPVSPSGNIQSSGTVGYKTGKGWWMGFDRDSIPKFFVGDSAANNVTWDGSTLTITGTVTGSTVIGGTFETATSGQRITINESSNNLEKFYDSSGLVITIGTTSLYAVTINPTSVTNNGINVTSSQAGNAFNYTNTANVNSRAIFVTQTGTTSNLSSVDITYKGTASIIAATLSSGSTGNGITLTLNGTGSGTAIDIVSASTAAPGLQINAATGSGNGAVVFASSGAASTVYISGSAQTGNVGMLRLDSTNSGDAVYLTQSINSVLSAIGMHMAITNAAGATGTAFFRFEGDPVISAAVAGTQDQCIRVLVGSTAYYIPCYTSHA